jgi:UDP-N-acetyl-D-glucosamine/UDP-N-acetyl-D-galactosamine dehydrogenase
VTNDIRIAIIGLGYVGLPLAVEFARLYPVIGYDISSRRVKELQLGIDRTREVDDHSLASVLADADQLSGNMHDQVSTLHVDSKMPFHDGDDQNLHQNSFRGTLRSGFGPTEQLRHIKNCNVFIVTVPTPVDKNRRPDLGPLLAATKTVAGVLKHGDLAIYESTVYPGATEEDCVPILESISGLRYNTDFFCGYSPERINPGDKEHTLSKILKVTSGSNPEAAERVDALYASIISAGTYRASSIRVAEAAKVIENAQRDINIAFVNELAVIFNRIGLSTNDVLAAAGTKWNFLPFKPGLVGGHCIGVDPYYLTHKAQEIGYNPEIILAGRRLNDAMGSYVAGQLVKLMIRKGHRVNGARVLILGITFKENCPDIRNSKVIDVVRELSDFGCDVSVYDPWAV